MQKMSISEAARQSGITRQYMHKLIKAGTITASTDEMGNRYVDSSELLRAFDGRLPKIKPPSTKETVLQPVTLRNITLENNSVITGLQVEVKLLREQLLKEETREHTETQLLRDQVQEYRQREQRLLDQVDKLTDTIKQIEHKASIPETVPTVPAGPLAEIAEPVKPIGMTLWKILTTPIRLRG